MGKQITIALINPQGNDLPTALTESLAKNDAPHIELKNGSYANLFNDAIDKVKTEFVMFMNVGDTIIPNYTNDLGAHINAYPDVNAFLPIVHEIGDEGKTIGLKNESAWVYGTMQTIGEFNLDALKNKPSFSLAGLAIKTATAKQFRMKQNIKVHYNYEWVMRYLNSGNKLMIVPKIGAAHDVTKSDYYLTAKDMGRDELKFWYNTAKKEYYFPNDREITYK